MSTNKRIRLYLRYLLILLAVPLLLMGIFYWHEFNALMDNDISVLQARENYRVSEKVTLLRQSLLGPVDNVLSLTREPRNRRALASRNLKQIKSELSDALMSMMYRNPDYMQIRWIDNAGREQIRIERKNGNVYQVPDSLLQIKVHRPYVRHAMALAPGQVYVSGLDLNVENKKIERPFRPTLRFCSHHYTDNGLSMGVFVINTSATHVFHQVTDTLPSQTDINWFFANSAGDWLVGPSKKDEWGMLLGHNASLRTYAPKIWKKVRSHYRGQAWDKRGLWSWYAIRPDAQRKDIVNAEYWNVIGFVSQAEINAVRVNAVQMATRNATLIFPIFLILCLVGAYFQVKRREAMGDLADRLHEESESKAKSEFLANMSHEIRTPMNAVIGLLQVLGDSPLTPYQQDLTKKITNAAQALLSILNDVLDYSKIETGQLELDYAPLVIDDIFQKLSDLFSLAASMKGLELIFGYDSGVPVVLKGDGQRLTQVLGNLVGNAVKFTSYGSVTVSVEVDHWEANDVCLAFSVCDTGIGMNKETIEKIFMPFVQADAGTSRRFGGSGLGLSISRHLVQLMGGEISASGEPGVGSCFRFTAIFHAETKSLLVRQKRLEGRRVLVLDSSDEAREKLAQTLRLWGMLPVEFGSVAEALEGVQENTALGTPFDFVVTDFNTLAMSHNPFYSYIDGVFEGGRIVQPYTILLVSSSQSADLSQYPSVSAVLSKPVIASRLLETLLSWDSGENLELRAAEAKKEGTLLARASAIQGARVLLVEDNLLNQEVASTLLRKMGLQLEIANNGLEAVEMVGHGSFDVILMDLQMPVMDGFDATQIIREKPGCEKIPIIAMTAAVFDSDRQAAIKTGMNDHISKPIDTNLLLASLLRHISPEVQKRAAAEPPADLAEDQPETGPALPEDLPGFDLVAALNRLMGDEALLMQMLRRFLRDYQDFSEKLEHAVSQGNSVEAVRLVHTLKGAAGTIGAVDLQACAAKNEEVLRADGSLAGDELRIILSETLMKLQESVPPERPKFSSSPVRGAEAMAELNRLEPVLQKHGVVGDKEMQTLTGHLGQMAESAVAVQLRDQIDRFDYTSALQSLQELRELIRKAES